MSKTDATYQVHAIGAVRRDNDQVSLEIWPQYRPALKQLEHFSHVMVFWWADRLDDPHSRQLLTMRPPYAEDYETGVFASRSPLRPNPIGMTTCKLLKVDHDSGRVHVAAIDALDGTPLLDLKAYFPVCDRVQQARIPAWLADWPDWMPEEGSDLEAFEK